MYDSTAQMPHRMPPPGRGLPYPPQEPPRRILTLRPLTMAIAALSFALVTAWASAVTWYVVSSDDVAAELLRREARLKAGYEESIAVLRSRLDRITSQKLLEQDSLEDRVAALVGRQVELETRQAMLFNLGTHIDIAGLDLPDLDPQEGFAPTPLADSGDDVRETGSLSRHPVRRPSPILSQRPRPAPVVSGARRPDAAPEALPPEPEALPPAPEDDAFSLRLRESHLSPSADPGAIARPEGTADADDAVTANLAERLRAVEGSLAQVEADQFMRLDAVNESIAKAAKKLRDVIVQTGLDPDALDASGPGGEATGIGGPYLPVGIDPEGGPFEAMVWMLQENLSERERLQRASEQLPFARPASRQFSLSSGFGVRRDPFTGRPALHAGIDFRTPRGTPIRAAGAGRVVTAGRSGGYGNLVEIDHGNGVTTRYAHLSSIAVERGQIVNTGDHLGRAGSTGRSTGPHLHYETRVDDEPVDPNRFLRAGRILTKLQE